MLAHLSVTTVAQQKSVGCRCLKERTTHGKCPNISGSAYCRFVICLEIFLAHSLSDSHKRITALNTKVLGQIILNYFLQLFTAQGASWWPPGSQMFLIFNIQIEIIIFYSEIFTRRVSSWIFRRYICFWSKQDFFNLLIKSLFIYIECYQDKILINSCLRDQISSHRMFVSLSNMPSLIKKFHIRKL